MNTDQTLKEDVNLTVGNAAQTVTVQADALQVQSETSELSTLITGQQVRPISYQRTQRDRTGRSGFGGIRIAYRPLVVSMHSHPPTA